MFVLAVLASAALNGIMTAQAFCSNCRTTMSRPTMTFVSSSSLQYRDDKTSHESTNDVLTIPVLGPFPSSPPLMMGAELALDPPTPMQWHTLQEALKLHKLHLKQSNQAGIDAAPLVAILDDYTSSSSSCSNSPNGRYATIAAVVGISNSQSIEQRKSPLDTSDSGSFMESVLRVGRNASPMESRIRLVGVGRAALSDFFYQVPTHVKENMDEEGHLILNNPEESEGNIVMAQFRLLTDGQDRSDSSFRKESKVRSTRCSPVHALNEMNSLANKLQYMHEKRRNLVAGLKAATLRLQRSRETATRDEEDDLLDDMDGIGELFAKKELETTKSAFDEVMGNLIESKQRHAASGEERSSNDPSSLSTKDNYGMGSSSSAVSTITDLTSFWMERLTPYYSPARCDTEEHYFEILSFVSILALDKFVTPDELGWALQCTNTAERMQRAYESMYDHIRLLQEEAERLSQELTDCGEECTDLW